MTESRLHSGKADILACLHNQPVRIFRQADLAKILNENRGRWHTKAGPLGFISFLLEQGDLQKFTFNFPKPYKKETRYAWNEVPLYEVCMAIRPNGYFSHYTAMRFNNLTEQLPKSLYLNVEQANESISSGRLTQASIDSAMRRSPRNTKQVADIWDNRLVILQGKNTNQLGVITRSVDLDLTGTSTIVRFTDLERTLIDAAVRPQYSGGVAEVKKAFVLARSRLSISRLFELFKSLNFIYPYHQVIGFYLQRAGYSMSDIEPFRQLPMHYDFQIAHGLKEIQYSTEWRLRIPKGF
jgi:hypothetical protein